MTAGIVIIYEFSTAVGAVGLGKSQDMQRDRMREAVQEVIRHKSHSRIGFSIGPEA